MSKQLKKPKKKYFAFKMPFWVYSEIYLIVFMVQYIDKWQQFWIF